MQFKKEVSAGGVVFKKDKDGIKCLIVRLASHKEWGFPKGHVGDNIANESIKEAALREVKEEGGVEAEIIHDEPFTVEYMFKLKGFLIKKNVHYFLMRYKSGDIKNHDWEIDDIKFATEDEVLSTLKFKSSKEVFEKALNIFKLI